MESRAERLQRRNEKIVKRFTELSDKKYKGKTKLWSHNTVMVMLSEEFYLSTSRIEDIIYGRN